MIRALIILAVIVAVVLAIALAIALDIRSGRYRRPMATAPAVPDQVVVTAPGYPNVNVVVWRDTAGQEYLIAVTNGGVAITPRLPPAPVEAK